MIKSLVMILLHAAAFEGGFIRSKVKYTTAAQYSYFIDTGLKKEANMKLTHIEDVDGFFKVVDSCKGKVELVSAEGDRLNLKSKLSQFISFEKILGIGEIPELELVVYDHDDVAKFINFTMQSNVK